MRAWLTTAIGIFAFMLTCAILKTALPPLEIDIVSPKLREFIRHKDEFNAVFLGSSHVQQQLSPAIFDRITGEAGLQTHSFNFGVNAMHIPESGYVLECLAKSRPANLRWVFLELDEIQVWRLEGQVGTGRSVYWHDWKRTSLILQKTYGRWIISLKAVRDLIIPRRDKGHTRNLFPYHVGLFAENFTNLGRGFDVTERFFDSQKDKELREDVGARGYIPNRKQMSAQQREAYETELANAMTDTRPRIVSLPTEDACRQAAEIVRKLGAVPVFLVTPVTQQSQFRFRQSPGAVLSFNDAKHYPSLYRSEARVDVSHLNAAAAEEFSRDVAEEFARLVHENQIR